MDTYYSILSKQINKQVWYLLTLIQMFFMQFVSQLINEILNGNIAMFVW